MPWSVMWPTPSCPELCGPTATADTRLRFRQKLRFVPFGQGRPVWVDDRGFDLGWHVGNPTCPDERPAGPNPGLRESAGKAGVRGPLP